MAKVLLFAVLLCAMIIPCAWGANGKTVDAAQLTAPPKQIEIPAEAPAAVVTEGK